MPRSNRCAAGRSHGDRKGAPCARAHSPYRLRGVPPSAYFTDCQASCCESTIRERMAQNAQSGSLKNPPCKSLGRERTSMRSMRKENGPRRRPGLMETDTVSSGMRPIHSALPRIAPFMGCTKDSPDWLSNRISGRTGSSKKAGGVSNPDPSALADALHRLQPQPEWKRDSVSDAVDDLNAAFRFETPGFFLARTELDACFTCRHVHRGQGLESLGSPLARRIFDGEPAEVRDHAQDECHQRQRAPGQ